MLVMHLGNWVWDAIMAAGNVLHGAGFYRWAARAYRLAQRWTAFRVGMTDRA